MARAAVNPSSYAEEQDVLFDFIYDQSQVEKGTESKMHADCAKTTA